MDICETSGKFSHATYAKALAHLRGLQRKYIYRQGEVYRCRDCHGFHVGRPAKELKALNRRLRA